jgi:hypothetical protein
MSSRWDRPRIGILVYLDCAACLVAIVACRIVGRVLMALGTTCRPWLPPEFAHRAFLRTLRIMYWQPTGWER